MITLPSLIGIAAGDGYIAEMEADSIGTAAMWLGAGRATKESTIDLAVGLVLKKKIGDEVKKGESIFSTPFSRLCCMGKSSSSKTALYLVCYSKKGA